MSLMIDIDKVSAVLLGNIWYEVDFLAEADHLSSFYLDSYEFQSDGEILLAGGAIRGLVSTGFTFRTPGGSYIYGPITAIQAVRVVGRDPDAP